MRVSTFLGQSYGYQRTDPDAVFAACAWVSFCVLVLILLFVIRHHLKCLRFELRERYEEEKKRKRQPPPPPPKPQLRP